jgi:hypothetical protein
MKSGQLRWKNQEHSDVLYSMKIAVLLVIIAFMLTSGQSGRSVSGFPAGGIGIILSPADGEIMTTTIQQAIDSCEIAGGGVVWFSPGTYLSGSLQLKSNVTLHLENGVLLQGSDDYSDYQNDAFIYGRDLTNISITGGGTIDGVDCHNPKGEEGFRGPHCIRLVNCKNIEFRGFTIINSANWAINARHCSNATIENVSIRGGHDGLHTQFCDNFKVSNCDFRTGDDAFAGSDNRDFIITDTKINTSCHGFRMGCYNLTVERCIIWGPGEYVHKVQERHNTLSAFTHFSPKDRNPQLESSNWIIRDVIIENADHVYNYNYRKGLWQTGQPAKSVKFERVKATGILSAFNIVGDPLYQFDLQVTESSFAFREGSGYQGGTFEGAPLASPALFNATEFNNIELRDVTLEKSGLAPLLMINSGKRVVLDNIRFITGHDEKPYLLDGIGEVWKGCMKTH